MHIEKLRDRQLKQFGLNHGSRLRTPSDAEKYLRTVGIALRYWYTPTLPLASLYQAAWGVTHAAAASKSNLTKDEAQRKGIELTNHLLAKRQGIEISVIAGRLCLTHRDLMPSLYCLARRHRDWKDFSGLSRPAREAFELIRAKGAATVGDVRKLLGGSKDPRKDPAYLALAELQKSMLVDRGPFEVPKAGIPYLSREGYPYRCVHEVHGDLVAAAAEMTPGAAAQSVVLHYLRGAFYCPMRKLIAMFKEVMSKSEILEAVAALSSQNLVAVEKLGRDALVMVQGRERA